MRVPNKFTRKELRQKLEKSRLSGATKGHQDMVRKPVTVKILKFQKDTIKS
jgi:hypothetical protein